MSIHSIMSCPGRPFAPRCAAIVFLCFSHWSVSQAQTDAIDSLRTAVVSGSQETKVKASTLYKLSREFWDHDLDSAFAVAEELLAFSQRSNYATGIGHAYSSMGVVRWYQGNYPDAQHYNELALKAHLSVDPQRSTDVAGAYHNLGLVHDDEGNYPEALKYYLEAMKVRLKSGRFGSVLSALIVALSPLTKTFASNDGRLASTRISPDHGSSATIAPFWSPRAFSAAA